MNTMIVSEIRGYQSEPIAVLLVGGQPVFRRALCTLFDDALGFRVVGEAATPRQALAAIARLNPDVVLVSLTGRPLVRMMRAVRNLVAGGCDTRAIVMTTSPDTVRLVEAEELCVAGFLSNTTPPQALIDSVRRVAGERCSEWDEFDRHAARLVRPRRDGDRIVLRKGDIAIADAVARCYHAGLN